jgi:hypothetical protein
MRVTRVLALALFALPLTAVAGNGAPSGAHYNLNIIGHTQCSKDDLKDTNRHNIQVLLNGGDSASSLNGSPASNIDKRNKIYLAQSTDGTFAVLDGNACDGDGAEFQLPAPGSYQIYARALGKPGGAATMTTCATGAGVDLILGTPDDEIICSTESVILVRGTGKSLFRNVTTELTTIYADINGDLSLERISLFDTRLYDYFWNYDNNGLRLTQLRLYPN